MLLSGTIFLHLYTSEECSSWHCVPGIYSSARWHGLLDNTLVSLLPSRLKAVQSLHQFQTVMFFTSLAFSSASVFDISPVICQSQFVLVQTFPSFPSKLVHQGRWSIQHPAEWLWLFNHTHFILYGLQSSLLPKHGLSVGVLSLLCLGTGSCSCQCCCLSSWGDIEPTSPLSSVRSMLSLAPCHPPAG